MGYLRHKHTFTCFKTNNDKKHYPLPVMPNTMILQPFPTEERDKWKEKYLAIKNFHHKLYKSKQDELIPFENILQTLNMNEEEYINSLRYSIKKSKVFLRRNSLEIAINCYNPTILSLFEANIDLQFVVEEYAVANYIVNYISKVEGGMSKLLREAAADIDKGHVSL